MSISDYLKNQYLYAQCQGRSSVSTYQGHILALVSLWYTNIEQVRDQEFIHILFHEQAVCKRVQKLLKKN